jgi:tetratricopeptide (TPR) repeat protein
MAKIRVHELAKELNVSSKLLITYFQRINVDANSHMSSIEKDMLERIRPDIEKNISIWKNKGLFSDQHCYHRKFPDGSQKTSSIKGRFPKKRYNPYISANPVGKGHAYIGRRDLLENIVNTLDNPNEYGTFLYGQRRIGKSSVLQRLAQQLSDHSRFVPVYVDLQDKAALTLDQLLKQLAENISYYTGSESFDQWTTDIQYDFQHVFIPYVLEQLHQQNCLVLLFDEFDILDTPTHDQAVSAFFPFVKKLMALDSNHLKFVFVIGRRPEELSNVYHSNFIDLKSNHVSLLNPQEAESLIRLSEQNESMIWSSQTIEKVIELTSGHPYLTQQLCQVIWDKKHEKKRLSTVYVEYQDIENSLSKALACSTNSLEWLWDGLGPAERVIISALAECGPELISQENLKNKLQENGVRIVSDELHDAPRVLEEWNYILSENGGFRMRVEMLRQWIVEKKPLFRVKDELDRIVPVAENLFQAAYRLYQSGELNETRHLLKRSLGHNPNHMKANQLLADILIDEGNFLEARKLLEMLYEYNPSLARPRLIQTLLSQAKQLSDESEQLSLYETVLNLDEHQPEALSECSRLWEKKGDHAFKQNNYDFALTAYEKAGNSDKIENVKQTIHLNALYLEAIQSLKQNNRNKSIQLFVKVISLNPLFRETSRYFHMASTNVDVLDLEDRLKKQQMITAELRKELLSYKTKIATLESEKKALENSSVVRERKDLQEQIQALEQEKLELRALQHKLKKMIEQSVESKKEKVRQNRQFQN